MKKTLTFIALALALSGSVQAADPFDFSQMRIRTVKEMVAEDSRQEDCRHDENKERVAELEEQAEELQAEIDAQNSTVIISSGVSRDVRVMTSGQIIDLRR